MFPDHYHHPDEFRYDEVSMDTDPVVIDKDFTTFNGDSKAESMRLYILKDSLEFATN